LSSDDAHETEEGQCEKADAEGKNDGGSYEDFFVGEVTILPDDIGGIGCITHASCVKCLIAKDDKVLPFLFRDNASLRILFSASLDHLQNISLAIITVKGDESTDRDGPVFDLILPILIGVQFSVIDLLF
jgi:hypothetical protein